MSSLIPADIAESELKIALTNEGILIQWGPWIEELAHPAQ